MNPRRRITWIVYALCVALLVQGLAWVSWSVVKLENREAEARVLNERQEAERLALWRMDSLITPLIAQESDRPYFQYKAFVPAGRTFETAWQPAPDGAAHTPSPLLSDDAQGVDGVRRFVKLHFLIDPDGEISSPEAPTDADIARAGVPVLDYARVDESASSLDELAGVLRGERGVRAGVLAKQEIRLGVPVASRQFPTDGRLAGGDDKVDRSLNEYAVRSQIADIASNRRLAVEQSGEETRRYDELLDSVGAAAPEGDAPARGEAGFGYADAPRENAEQAKAAGDAAPTPAGDFDEAEVQDALAPGTALGRAARRIETGRVRVGSFDAVWAPAARGPELLLVRDVVVDGGGYRQGVWLDWALVRDELLAAQRDLFPASTLDPIVDAEPPEDAADASRRLATIPVRYTPGGAPAPPTLAMTPARWSLLVTWIAVIAAIVAIGVVLNESIKLSDRRGRFVSAVTHELRTPLTTFRLYSGMLADGMVTDDTVRAEYLDTLKRESGRLSGIVENVLEYARLGRRATGRPAKVGPVRPDDLVVRLRPVLSRRAEQGGMDLIVSSTLDADDPRVVYADPQSVERIMANLIENACRYAAPTDEDDAGESDTRIHLDVGATETELELLVADYGPGVAHGERARIFGEFRRGGTGARADRSGLGLGLALSRALAREADGDLRLVRRRGHGAEFLLTLPLHAPARA